MTEPMRLPVLPPPTSTEDNIPLLAVEFEAVISPGRHVMLPQGQSLKFNPTLVGRTVTVWVSHRTVHVLLDGQLSRTRSMNFTDADLHWLIMRGGRPAGTEPQGGLAAGAALPPLAVVEVDRKATKNGVVSLEQTPVALGTELIGKRVTLRFDGSMMFVIHAGLLVKTLAAPIPHQRRAKLTGARIATTPLPPPPSQPRQAIRRIGADGTFEIARQKLRPGIAHAGKTVTVIIEEIRFRVSSTARSRSPPTPAKATPSPATSPTPADRQRPRKIPSSTPNTEPSTISPDHTDTLGAQSSRL